MTAKSRHGDPHASDHGSDSVQPLNTLAYIDSVPLLAIAAKLVGNSVSTASSDGGSIGFQWGATFEARVQESREIQRDLALFLPEDLMYEVYGAIPQRHSGLQQVKAKLTTGTEGGFRPGSVVSIEGRLERPEGAAAWQAERFHGEDALAAQLASDDLRLQVRIPHAAREQADALVGEPVELTGILRWTPGYSPGGSATWNLALRAVAIWLR